MPMDQTFFRHRPTSDQPRWKLRLYTVVFESGTRAGKMFDLALLVVIGISVAEVMMESVDPFRAAHPDLLRNLEWTFTILFTLEYIARLLCVRDPWGYVFSFYGVIDLVAFLPSYINLVTSTANYFFMIRVLRLLRVFRILKLTHYLEESRTLVTALRASRPKITVFLFSVLVIVLVVGTLMCLIEGDENGFDSIPHGVYWAIVTLTTVGYGDITPHTVLGRILACVIMIMGYGIIAVPTGIFSVELHQAAQMKDARPCANCQTLEKDRTARFCRHCGQAFG
ncbi:MAG: ion transporter [Chthoniobacterales bacterium]